MHGGQGSLKPTTMLSATRPGQPVPSFQKQVNQQRGHRGDEQDRQS